jgi:hypothetical protein
VRLPREQLHLFVEALFSGGVGLWVDFLEGLDASVHKLFFGEEGFEDGFFVFEVESVEVFGFDLFFGGDVDAIETSELGYAIQDLEAVVLLALNRIERQVELREQGQVLDIGDLPHLADLVPTQVEEAQVLALFKSFQSAREPRAYLWMSFRDMSSRVSCFSVGSPLIILILFWASSSVSIINPSRFSIVSIPLLQILNVYLIAKQHSTVRQGFLARPSMRVI